MTTLSPRAYHVEQLIHHILTLVENLSPEDLTALQAYMKFLAKETVAFPPDVKTLNAVVALLKTFP